MSRSTERLFVLDGDGDVTVEVTFDLTPGSPAITWGLPEDCDPGSGAEVEVTKAVVVESDDPDRPVGTDVTLSEAEDLRFYNEMNEDPETWEPDDGPEYEDF